MSVAAGSRLGSYEVVGLLGAGGMGEVYRAHHRALGRDVALKVLPAAVSHDPDRVARFEREARAVAALSHPNILAIHDFGCDNGVHYAVTELLDGQTLRDLLHTGPVPVPKAMAITTQIARGLEAAHAGGIVHRDLKPENVFVLRDGQIKILDFGLAKAAPIETGATTQLIPGVTEAGTVVGTAGYMSPEQVRRDPVDHRSDLFSLGCVFYEMLAGRRAFQGDSSIDTLHATLHADPPNVATLVPVPEPLARIVSRCLEKHPGNRFQSAADLRFALDTITESSRSAVRPPIAERRPRPVLRMVVAAIVIVAAVAAGWYWRGGAGRGAATPATALSQPRGIAVLPFDSVGGPDQTEFAAGVTEEVTLQLAKISALRVIGRNAVARFKDPAAQLPDMARDLGIGAVLTGNVRQAGSQVRVGVQLLAAPSGETMWSERYDRTVANIFDVQSDIAVRVARALRASLAPEERQRIERVPTTNAEAYELYLQQRRLSFLVAAQNDQGIALLEQAIALDPQFALGHAVLANRLVFRGNMSGGRAEYRRAVEVGRNAVRIDPYLARGHYALGLALNRVGQVDDARLSMQRAIELDGNNQSAMNDLSLLEVGAGRLDQSAYWAMRGWPLAPNVPNSYYHVAIPLLFLDNAAGERWLAAAAARFKPDDPAQGERIPRMQAIVAMFRGDLARAVALARDSVRARPDVTSSHHMLAEIATYAGTADAQALVDKELEQAPDARGVLHGITPRTLRAYLYIRAGRPESARPLLETVLDINRKAQDDGDRRSWFETVAAHALLGNREAAVVAWERVVGQGFPDATVDVSNPLLASIKDDSRFVAAMDRLRGNVAAMRARVDLSVIDEWIARGAPVNPVR